MASTVRGGPTRTSCSDCPARLASSLCQACDHVATMRSPHCRGRCGGRPVGPLASSDDEMGRNTRPAGGAWGAGARAGVRPVCGVLVSSSDKLYPCYGIERPSAGAMLPCRRPAVESGRCVGCDALAHRSRHAPHPVYPVHPCKCLSPGITLTRVGFCLHQDFRDGRMSRMGVRGGRPSSLAGQSRTDSAR